MERDDQSLGPIFGGLPQRPWTRREFLRRTGAAALALGVGCRPQDAPAIQVFHAPARVSRRTPDLGATVCGAFAPRTREKAYRINEGSWLPIINDDLRVPEPLFTIEASSDDLHVGRNTLDIRGVRDGETVSRTVEFEYDPSPIALPLTVDWAQEDLAVADGHWEVVENRDGTWVRPVPGSELYDRLLLVAGAFPQGRRIDLDLVYRADVGSRLYGFGMLSLWGGRPDQPRVTPRRGWSFGLAWYYSRYQGVGSEFSYKFGAEEPRWASTYRDLSLEPGVPYHVAVEVWPERDDEGTLLRYRQRMQWTPRDRESSFPWLELTDVEGAPLPDGEYGVALIAHRSQVEFGSVTIQPLDGTGDD